MIRFCARVLFAYLVSLATVALLLAASGVGEANRCARLDPGTTAHTTYCEAGR